MKHCVSRPVGRIIVSLAAVMIVFGLAILMVVERYNAAVITSVVTGTSLDAAELVRRLQAPAPADPDHTPTERS
jgi:hypothetical protein